MIGTKGRRVGAILNVGGDTETVNVLGFGVHVGEFVPPLHWPLPMFGMYLEEAADTVHGPDSTEPDEAQWHAFVRDVGGCANPKIELDSGAVVWGRMCWWGAEEAVTRAIAVMRDEGYTVHEMTAEDIEAMEEPFRARRREFEAARAAAGLPCRNTGRQGDD